MSDKAVGEIAILCEYLTASLESFLKPPNKGKFEGLTCSTLNPWDT